MSDLCRSNLHHPSNLDHEGGPDTQSFTPRDHAVREETLNLLFTVYVLSPGTPPETHPLRLLPPQVC